MREDHDAVCPTTPEFTLLISVAAKDQIFLGSHRHRPAFAAIFCLRLDFRSVDTKAT